MFDIGFPELVLIAIVGLLVIGPERLPEALRSMGLWLGRMRRSFTSVKAEIEKEIGMDEVRRQLHNEAIMDEMKRIESEVKGTAEAARSSFNEGIQAAQAPSTDPNATDPNAQGEVDDMIAAQNSIGGQPTVETVAEADVSAQTQVEPDDTVDETGSSVESDERDHTDAGAEAGAEAASETASTDPVTTEALESSALENKKVTSG